MTKRKHWFTGEDAGTDLVRFLNSGKGVSQRRVIEIVDLYHKIGKGPPKRLSPSDEAAYNRLQKLLNRYTYNFQVWSHTSTLVPSRKLKASGRAKEAAAVEQLHPLRAINLLPRIRRCDRCREWIFARFPSQHFCGPACRVKAYQANPVWIKKRNKQRMDAYHERKKSL